MVIEELTQAAARLRDDVDLIGKKLVDDGKIDCVYNPLIYAWEPHKAFIELGGGRERKHSFQA